MQHQRILANLANHLHLLFIVRIFDILEDKPWQITRNYSEILFDKHRPDLYNNSLFSAWIRHLSRAVSLTLIYRNNLEIQLFRP